MDGFRAKDADRDRFVAIIEAAYVDGQLGAEDRELRISRALAAASVSELEALTRDLQVPVATGTERDVSSQFPPQFPPQLPRQGATRPPRLAGALVAVVAVVGLLVVGVTSLALFASGDPESASPSGVIVVESEQAGEVPAGFTMTPPQVRSFLRGYEKKFGTSDAFQTAFYPSRVSVEVPVRGPRPRFERWSYDGTWRQDSEASRVTGPDAVIDLGAVDVRRLFDNVDTARRTLGVQRGRLTHVVVHGWDGVPTVNIYIGNSFNENGYLKTTMSGDEVRRFPYEP